MFKASGCITKELVINATKRGALRGEMPASPQPHWFPAGRTVERFRDRSPPIHHQDITGLARHCNAADIEPLVVFLKIDSTEAQRLIAEFQRRESLCGLFDDHIAFVSRLERTSWPDDSLIRQGSRH